MLRTSFPKLRTFRLNSDHHDLPFLAEVAGSEPCVGFLVGRRNSVLQLERLRSECCAWTTAEELAKA